MEIEQDHIDWHGTSQVVQELSFQGLVDWLLDRPARHRICNDAARRITASRSRCPRYTHIAGMQTPIDVRPRRRADIPCVKVRFARFSGDERIGFSPYAADKYLHVASNPRSQKLLILRSTSFI
tara:strand:- start:22315 stop:22686 length:372 start_codon:yes stop_codon:yes gene_type:complete